MIIFVTIIGEWVIICTELHIIMMSHLWDVTHLSDVSLITTLPLGIQTPPLIQGT